MVDQFIRTVHCTVWRYVLQRLHSERVGRRNRQQHCCIEYVGCVLRAAVLALMIVLVSCNGRGSDLLAQVYKEAAPSERLYEQCSAASALCARLTMTAQVYGGSLSLVVGAYLWSKSQQDSSDCSAGATVVSGLWTELNNIRISGSQAGTYSIGGTFQPHNHTFRMHEHLGTSLIVLTRF